MSVRESPVRSRPSKAAAASLITGIVLPIDGGHAAGTNPCRCTGRTAHDQPARSRLGTAGLAILVARASHVVWCASL